MSAIDKDTTGERLRAAGVALGWGAFHTLRSGEKSAYVAHLQRLSAEDRRRRFRRNASNDDLRRHADAVFDNPDAEVIGWFRGGELRGAAELVVYASAAGDAPSAEAAFAVEPNWRRIGVGRRLIHRAALHARNRGARRMHISTEIDNRGMMRLAQTAGMRVDVEMRDAEGVLDSPGRTFGSICLETLEEEVGLVGYAWNRALRRLWIAARRVATAFRRATGRPRNA